MKNRRFLYGIFLAAILMIAIFAVFVLPVDVPQTENITEFEYVDIKLPENSWEFYYSFVPDGSGILYIEGMQASNDKSRFIFHHLDFASRETEIIYESDFDESTPAIYWRDTRVAFLSAKRSDGICSLNGGVNFNLNTGEKTEANCPGGAGLTNPEIDSEHPNIITRSNPEQYREIHSADKQYYFLWKIEFDCFLLTCLGEPSAKNYIEIFNAEDEMIRRIYLGETGQTSIGPNYTGYAGFWSNTNHIVVIPAIGVWMRPMQYKVYFIDPEK